MRVLASGRTVRGKKFGESREGEKRKRRSTGGRGSYCRVSRARRATDEERERIAGVREREVGKGRDKKGERE